MISDDRTALSTYEFEVYDVRDLTFLAGEPDALEEVIINQTGEDNWDEPASIQVHGQQVFVKQTPDMQRSIQDVLAELRVSYAKSKR